MRASLRSLTVEFDEPRTFLPGDPTHFGVHVRALVGPDAEEGEESFDLLVCTPSWIESEQLTKGFRWGHGLLVVRRWDPDVLERAVGDLILHAERGTWGEIGELLSRYTHWEFADYRG
jgi:hypothetical protein